jgi:hypothetical protein
VYHKDCSPGGRESGDETQLRCRAASLPVADGRVIYSQPVSDVSLEQVQIEPTLPDVVAEGLQLSGVGGWGRLTAGQLDMARRQRNHVPVATTAVR